MMETGAASAVFPELMAVGAAAVVAAAASLEPLSTKNSSHHVK